MRMSISAKRGIALVEFALVLPLMLLLFAGVLDFTLLLRTAIAASDAARAGAQYGSANSTDTAGMVSKALDAAPDIADLRATAVRSCGCSDGTSVPCPGSCPSGAVLVYVTVTAWKPVTAIFSYSQVPFPGAVLSTATMRAQ
jgi:Flp pilus assembly protein TadG